MLKQQVRRVVQENTELRPVSDALEQEIIYHDIIQMLVVEGLMQQLTLIGGAALRMCYNSQRLSEGLCFTAGHDFNASDFNGLEAVVQQKLQNKYEIRVKASKTAEVNQGNTTALSIIVEREVSRPDLSNQIIHINVYAVPSLDVEIRPLINHYSMVVPTEGLLVSVPSLKEIFADKLIALAFPAGEGTFQHIWDILWLRQRGTGVSKELIDEKLAARKSDSSKLQQALAIQVARFLSRGESRQKFTNVMQCLLPKAIQERTLNNDQYWSYVRSELNAIGELLRPDYSCNHPFDMG